MTRKAVKRIISAMEQYRRERNYEAYRAAAWVFTLADFAGRIPDDEKDERRLVAYYEKVMLLYDEKYIPTIPLDKRAQPYYNMGMKAKLKAWWLGIKDGFAQPYDLTSGITWENNPILNEFYDRGVSLGQLAGKLFVTEND